MSHTEFLEVGSNSNLAAPSRWQAIWSAPMRQDLGFQRPFWGSPARESGTTSVGLIRNLTAAMGSHTLTVRSRATYPAPFRLTRTRLPCRGEQPTLATAQTLRRPRGHLRTQHGRCFSPTSATGSRHEHPPNRPTLAHGSSPQPTTACATGDHDFSADLARRPGTTRNRVGVWLTSPA